MNGSTADDRRFMLEALALAARPARRPWPNPPVGALVVRDGGIVGRGTHDGVGSPHAEAVALAEAGDRARGATLYCTLEPCNHQGRTPPCARSVIAAGVSRMVVAIRDPNPRVNGGGLEAARCAGIAVTLGVCADEALDLTWPFVASRAFERPFVWLKTAASLDGRFAPPDRPLGAGPVYLSGDEARLQVHRLRRWADVVLVGARTAAVDRPRLDSRLAEHDAACPPIDPMPAMATRQLAVEPPWRGRSHLVFVGPDARDETAEAVTASGGTVVSCTAGSDGIDPASIVECLSGMEKHCLLVEGGPSLAAAFLRAGLIDRWIHYTAPVVLGRGVGWPDWDRGTGAFSQIGTAPSRFTLTRANRCGRDVVAVWDRLPFDAVREELTAGFEHGGDVRI